MPVGFNREMSFCVREIMLSRPSTLKPVPLRVTFEKVNPTIRDRDDRQSLLSFYGVDACEFSQGTR